MLGSGAAKRNIRHTNLKNLPHTASNRRDGMGLTSRAGCSALTFTGEYMMSALSFDTVALSQNIDRRIADIYANPRSYYFSPFSGRRLSQGSKSEISSLQWLKALLGFVTGSTVSAGVFSALSPTNIGDRKWFIASIDVYLSQHHSGMACLLSEYIEILNACRLKISQPEHGQPVALQDAPTAELH